MHVKSFGDKHFFTEAEKKNANYIVVFDQEL